MAQIAHPETGDGIEVEVIDEESHHGSEMVQVQAVDAGIELSDESGEPPWLFVEEVDE